MKAPTLAVDVHRLSKTFGRRRVLSDITFQLDTGEFLLIFGPNGAGKTTLLKIMATLLSPSEGDANIAGFSIKTAPTEVRKRIGFISHSHLLYRDLTSYENLRFYGEMYGVPDLDDRITDLLRRVELDHRRFDVVRSFSRGMFQRLAIARALLHKPEVIFLDEPHTGLDPHAVDILDGLIDELKVKHTFVMVTHNLDRGLARGTRAVILDGGKIVYESDGRMEAATFRDVYRRVCDHGAVDECV